MQRYQRAVFSRTHTVHGIGYEVDCRDTMRRTGLALGGEVVRVAANIRTHVRRAKERRPIGVIPEAFRDSRNSELNRAMTGTRQSLLYFFYRRTGSLVT